MNAAYEQLQKDGADDHNLTVYYVMLEDAGGNPTTNDYCNMWKAQYNVAPPVIADAQGFMWNFFGKNPGTAVLVDKETMEIIFLTQSGDKGIYTYLFNEYLKN